MRAWNLISLGLAALALAACEAVVTAPATPVSTPTGPSAKSASIADYYERREADLLARGLLRRDGGGPDTPVDAQTLVTNFERLAFYDEYASSGRLRSGSGSARGLTRWQNPVRIVSHFGSSVSAEKRPEIRNEVSGYAARLARITNHSIQTVTRDANFHVLVMGADDRADVAMWLDRIAPGMDGRTRDIFLDPPRIFHCFVANFPSREDPRVPALAIAMIRAELPELLRKSCIHEEMAQGLGLSNDSPRARPSIFNDDDEFALLTSHDEALLNMLYDRRLRPGMRADEARPILQIMAREQLGLPL